MTRPDAFSSSGVNWSQEEKEVAAALKENGCQGRPRPPTDGQCPKKFLTIPDIGGLLENIRQFLKSLDFQVIFPWPPSAKCCHIQDRVPVEERKGVVYSISCTECPKFSDSQMLYWLKEHQCALRNGDMATSTVVEHALSTGNVVDVSKLCVLDCHQAHSEEHWQS